jgi:hypothetical protein
MTEAGPKEVAKLISIAGGEVIGATRLQKIACLIELAGATLGFNFAYHLYGPYSEQLDVAVSDAGALGLVRIEPKQAAWGGRYSVFRLSSPEADHVPNSLSTLATTAAKADSVELELAVTAAFLAANGNPDAWDAVAVRKKAKATPARLANAKALYQVLRSVENLPKSLPAI